MEKHTPKLKGIDFVLSSYVDLHIPAGSIVYCDIPYIGAKGYSFSKNFDHVRFWNWARLMVSMGHRVFVSEYNAPDDFICVWSQEVKSALSANGKSGGSKKSIEKLFIHKSQVTHDN